MCSLKFKILRAVIYDGVCVLFLAVFLASPSAAETRLALMISNSNYEEASSSLQNALSEAQSLRDELTNDGFTVQFKENLTKQGMKSALSDLQSKIDVGDTVLFFFNGIALQLNRQTYLIPVDAQIWTEADIKRVGISLDDFLSDLAGTKAGVKIIVIDAAKHNPFERHFRDVPQGLAAVDTPSGSLVLLSASPGKLVPDGELPASSFMAELVRQIRLPGNAEDAFRRTRLGVYHTSKGEQVPWVSSSLVGEFSFLTAGKGPSLSENEALPPITANPPASTSVSPAPTEPPTPASASSAGSAPENNGGKEPPPPGKQAQQETPSAPPSPSVSPQPSPSLSSPAGLAFRDCPTCPELVVVPKGEFTMGSSDHPHEKPAHRVKIAYPFAIGRYELTYAEWDRCVEAGACRYRPDDHGMQRDKFPVADVSWEDANTYVKWLSQQTGQNYRLPSEAEWEYAARAGGAGPFPWGNQAGTGNAKCADCGSGTDAKASAVGSYRSNAFGLFDTAGNVAELVQDCWNKSYNGAPGDGSPWLTGNCGLRGLRGGSFDNKAQFCRASARFRYDADVRHPANGFRVVRALQ